MQSSYSVFSIVGTTAVGKTDFAFTLAEALVEQKGFAGVDIISADSKQVYQGLELLTGADIPKEAKQYFGPLDSDPDFFVIGNVRLYGVSAIPLSVSWSVSDFQQYALDVMEHSFFENRAVLIVGGTGLYHKHLFNPDRRLHIPPDEAIRYKAEKLTVRELQEWLKEVDIEVFQTMNNSDQNNPRRLVRAIEKALADEVVAITSHVPENVDHHFIGLSLPFETITEKIEKRVDQRLEQGVIEEIKIILQEQKDILSETARSAIGFSQIENYLAKNISYDEMRDQWGTAERQYAKRQLTWWNKQAEIEWIDKSTSSWLDNAISQILKKY